MLAGITNCSSSNRYPKNKIVADAMASLRNELPIHLEGFGKVRDIDYEGKTVVFRMRIKDEVFSGMSVTKISNNQVLAKEIISLQIGMMNEREKEAIKAISGESFSLKVLISGSSSSRDGEINLSSAEIKTALINSPQKTAEDFSLEMIAMTTRLMLPIWVDQVTTWTDTRINEGTFEYIYYLDDNGFDFTSIDMEMMKREKLTMLSQNMDIMGNVVKCCIATNRSLVYKYIGKTSNKTISIVLTNSDLRNN